MREYTIQQILDAAIKNGFEHFQSGWFKLDYSNKKNGKIKIVGACFMGQAALNLGIENTSVSSILEEVQISESTLAKLPKTLRACIDEMSLTEAIVEMNDTLGWKYKTIAKWAQFIYDKDATIYQRTQVYTVKDKEYYVDRPTFGETGEETS